jgi:hypothetical protein
MAFTRPLGSATVRYVRAPVPAEMIIRGILLMLLLGQGSLGNTRIPRRSCYHESGMHGFHQAPRQHHGAVSQGTSSG